MSEEKASLEIEIWESSASRDYLKSMVLDDISIVRKEYGGGGNFASIQRTPMAPFASSVCTIAKGYNVLCSSALP